jgi:FdhE protein
MSAEEIAARAGGDTPFLHWPERTMLFAEREMRLRQLARQGHVMGDFLLFLAELVHAQHEQLLNYAQRFPSLPLPDNAALDRAARAGLPPLPAADWPRDPAWQTSLRAIAAAVRPRAPAPAQTVLQALEQADADWLERQADCLLTGVMVGLDLASAPIVAAALQVYWTHLLLQVQVQAHHGGQGQAVGRIDDETTCPCCGSRPTASLTRSSGESLGQRYLHCSLCSLQWHMVRIKCPHCLSGRKLAYFSLDTNDGLEQADAGADDSGAAAHEADEAQPVNSRAAEAVIQAETCDDCGHYLKIMHSDRDGMVEPVADDLASITLDLLVAEQTGKLRHGVNLMLLFGESDAAEPAHPPDRADDPPPDPGAA